jgi:hypothetical protein
MKEIIGNGDIASVLPEKKGLLFFASGVSNSQETKESEYRREKDLLMSQPKDKHIVYFGSLSVFYSDTKYAQHKLEMEKLIKENFEHWTIMRLGNIDWGVNPNTIINNFRDRKMRGEEIELQDGYRYICDKEEFLHWVGMIPEWNCEMNVPGKRMTIKEIYEYA